MTRRIAEAAGVNVGLIKCYFDSKELLWQEAADLAFSELHAALRARQAVTHVEEIVVQARTRAELLEDSPVSVTALGESTLREAGVLRLDDMQSLVPNLLFATVDDGIARDCCSRSTTTSRTP